LPAFNEGAKRRKGVQKMSEVKPLETRLQEVKLEDALKRLAEIVKSLEKNDCELDESLKLFEEGVALTRSCHTKLTEAERRIEILTRVSPVETKSLS